MGIKNIEKFCGAILVILGVCLIIFSLGYIDFDEKDKKVSCYDRFRNEIIGETCIEKADMVKDEFSMFFFLGFLTLLLGLAINSLSSIEFLRKPTNFFGYAVKGEQK